MSVNFAELGWLSDLPKFDRLSKAINILYTLYFSTVYIRCIHGPWKCMEVVKYHISFKVCAMQRRLLMISKLILMHAVTFTRFSNTRAEKLQSVLYLVKPAGQ